MGCARAWVGVIVRTAPWVVVAHSNLFSLGGATSGECFAAGERVLGSPTTCFLLPLYIRFYRLAAPCRVVSLPRGFSSVLSFATGQKAFCPAAVRSLTPYVRHVIRTPLDSLSHSATLRIDSVLLLGRDWRGHCDHRREAEAQEQGAELLGSGITKSHCPKSCRSM